jgi:hypothetical protein
VARAEVHDERLAIDRFADDRGVCDGVTADWHGAFDILR